MNPTPREIVALYEQTADIIAQSRAQFFFCGGHGGLVTYDGMGGPLEKEGGPIDRLFFLPNHGAGFRLGGDHGLDITHGSIRMRTGPLAQDVIYGETESGDPIAYIYYRQAPDKDAAEITGGITELGLPIGTVLFHGSIAPSEMRALAGRGGKGPNQLPYTALHLDFVLHETIARRFSIDVPVRGVAVSGWCKGETSKHSTKFAEKPPKWGTFRTQQHLGSLRIFVL